jgi:predicted nucleotidyltransferase
MPIPELNENGLLPEGVWDCTLEEIGARFGQFQRTDRRVQLFAKLCDLVAEERRAGLAVALMIDGSFVSGKPDPGDIDLVIVLPDGYNFAAELLPVAYNAISKSRLRRAYQFDVFVVEEQSPE